MSMYTDVMGALFHVHRVQYIQQFCYVGILWEIAVYKSATEKTWYLSFKCKLKIDKHYENAISTHALQINSHLMKPLRCVAILLMNNHHQTLLMIAGGRISLCCINHHNIYNYFEEIPH